MNKRLCVSSGCTKSDPNPRSCFLFSKIKADCDFYFVTHDERQYPERYAILPQTQCGQKQEIC
jgi:hypothetical protein